MAIRALVFDAYGTLYDVQSVRGLATELCGDKGDLITQLWRLKQLEYTWLRGLMRNYEDFWQVTRAALDYTLLAVGAQPEPAICEPLMQIYVDLDLDPEARAALDSLAPYKLAIPSNGSPMMLDKLVHASGVTDRFTDVISVDRVKVFCRIPPVTRWSSKRWVLPRKKCCSPRLMASISLVRSCSASGPCGSSGS